MTNKIDQTPHISTIEGDVRFVLDVDPSETFSSRQSLLEHVAMLSVVVGLHEKPHIAPELIISEVQVLERRGLANVLGIDDITVDNWLHEEARGVFAEDDAAIEDLSDDATDAIDAFIKALNSKRRYYRCAGRRCHVIVQDVRDMWTTLKEENET